MKIPDALHEAFKSEGPPVLLVLAGLPGLGKSSVSCVFANQHRASVLESDVIWKLICPRGFIVAMTGPGYNIMTTLVNAWLVQGLHAIVDSTALTRKHRARFLPPVEVEARRICAYFPPLVEESIRRRSGGVRIHPIPEDHIRSMAERWETPSVEEGFDAIYEFEPVGEDEVP